MKSVCGPSPHYVGLLETLQLAKELLLNVPKDVFILAVEAADCLTLGGAMHDTVKSTVGLVTDLVAEISHNREPAKAHHVQDSGDGFRRAIATATAHWGAKRLVVIYRPRITPPSRPPSRNEPPCAWQSPGKF